MQKTPKLKIYWIVLILWLISPELASLAAGLNSLEQSDFNLQISSNCTAMVPQLDAQHLYFLFSHPEGAKALAESPQSIEAIKSPILNEFKKEWILSFSPKIFRALHWLAPAAISDLDPSILTLLLSHSHAALLDWNRKQGQSITALQLNQFELAQIAKLPAFALSNLNTDAANGLTKDLRLAILQRPDAGSFSWIVFWLQSVTSDELNSLTANQWNALPKWAFTFVPVASFLSANDQTTGYLLRRPSLSMSSAELARLVNLSTPEQISGIDMSVLRRITEPLVFAKLDHKHRLLLIQNETVAGMSEFVEKFIAECFQSLSKEEVHSLDKNILYSFEEGALERLDFDHQFYLLSHPNVRYSIARTIAPLIFNQLDQKQIHSIPMSTLGAYIWEEEYDKLGVDRLFYLMTHPNFSRELALKIAPLVLGKLDQERLLLIPVAHFAKVSERGLRKIDPELLMVLYVNARLSAKQVIPLLESTRINDFSVDEIATNPTFTRDQIRAMDPAHFGAVVNFHLNRKATDKQFNWFGTEPKENQWESIEITHNQILNIMNKNLALLSLGKNVLKLLNLLENDEFNLLDYGILSEESVTRYLDSKHQLMLRQHPGLKIYASILNAKAGKKIRSLNRIDPKILNSYIARELDTDILAFLLSRKFREFLDDSFINAITQAQWENLSRPQFHPKRGKYLPLHQIRGEYLTLLLMSGIFRSTHFRATFALITHAHAPYIFNRDKSLKLYQSMSAEELNSLTEIEFASLHPYYLQNTLPAVLEGLKEEHRRVVDTALEGRPFVFKIIKRPDYLKTDLPRALGKN